MAVPKLLSACRPAGSPTYRYFCEISPFADEDLREGAVLDAMRTTLGVELLPNMERLLEIDLLYDIISLRTASTR